MPECEWLGWSNFHHYSFVFFCSPPATAQAAAATAVILYEDEEAVTNLVGGSSRDRSKPCPRSSCALTCHCLSKARPCKDAGLLVPPTPAAPAPAAAEGRGFNHRWRPHLLPHTHVHALGENLGHFCCWLPASLINLISNVVAVGPLPPPYPAPLHQPSCRPAPGW